MQGMAVHAQGTYPPLDTLKPVAEEVWIVDGPVIRFGMPWPKMPFPTRMTIVRIGADLFVHSPTPLTRDLRDEVDGIGRVRWIVGPNRLHYWWIPEWHRAYPDAEIYLAPRTPEQAGDHIDFPCAILDRAGGYPWDGAIATLPVAGSFMTEVVFFHRPSRTLLLADLIENFERGRIGPCFRLLARLGGVLDPAGGMPRDLRMTFSGRKPLLRAQIDAMIDWDPERIVIAHGRWYASGGASELRRAFRWLRG